MNKHNMSSPTNKSSAYLEIILGGMYAGKTSHIVEIYKQCKFCSIPVIAINHVLDNRYVPDDLISTHDQVKIPCIKIAKLMDLTVSHCEEIKLSNVILINEGQFFEDLENFVSLLLKAGKKIYVCGLDGDFERKKFGQILNLIPLCDKITKLTSLCSICKDGTPGIFSKRISNETEQTVVGYDNYIPVCRNCYEA